MDGEFVAALKNWEGAIEQTVEQVIDLLKKVEKTNEKFQRPKLVATQEVS